MEVTELVPVHQLAPYFKLAYEIAKQSPCLRRKYGAVVAYAGPDIDCIQTTNMRMNARCCGKDHCIRDRVRVPNGTRTEMGGEIHAETAALILTGIKKHNAYFILAGIDSKGKPLYGKDAYPCHACAMALKFAGYKYIHLLGGPDDIRAYSIAKILEDRMEEWQPEI